MYKHLLSSLLITAILSSSILSPVAAVSPEILATSSLYVSNNGDGLADRLQKAMATREDNFTKSELLNVFCTETLSYWGFTGEVLWGETVTYDPKQSMFMYIVCNSFIGNSKFWELFTNDEDGYIKQERHKLRWLNLICDERTGDDVNEIRQPVGCVPGCEISHMNECDFSLLMPKVIRPLFNDITNIGLGMTYGMIWIADEEVANETLANQFSVRYFSTILCDREWWTCLYPKTHKVLTNNLKNARKLLRKTKIVNSDTMITQATECTNPEQPEDLWWCTFASQNIVLAPVVDLMFNEIYYFQMMMAFYKSYLRTAPYLGEFTVGTNVRQGPLEQTAEEVERINSETTRTLQAVLMSNRILMQTQAYFPLHIALQTYNEATVSFRNTLAKVFQPLHQLMFKLINVQKTND